MAEQATRPMPTCLARICQRSPRAPRLAPRLPLRPGISLLEVLISMFVLLFGLMGVASIFPVGNHYAGRSDQYDRGAALADAGFAELKARGMLRPDRWLYADLAPGTRALNGDYRVIQPRLNPSDSQPNPTAHQFNHAPPGNSEPGPGYAFLVDPWGVASALVPDVQHADVFPYGKFDDGTPNGESPSNPLSATNIANPWESTGLPGNRWPIRRVTLPSNNLAQPNMSVAVASTICRLRDDLAMDTPEEDDRPGIQRWTANTNGTDEPYDDTPLARQSAGSYSWFATVAATTSRGVTALQPIDSMYGSELYEVSVAVLHRRVPAPGAGTERSIAAALQAGGELVMYSAGNADAVDAALERIRSGQWIALAGVNQGNGRFMLRWYRLLSLDEDTGPVLVNNTTYPGRRAMLDGPPWPTHSVNNLRAILVPGVIGVSTQYLPMEEVPL